ncbi:hypothetical protein [uncultured Chryseobacterium sp.]|nr:hypothetical protein [uncultured Chryseobacterium sp.]
MVIIRNFDNLMRNIFKDRWFRHKVKAARSRAEKAIKKQKSFQI